MVWVYFLISAIIISGAAMLLAYFGDAIAIRTRLGGLFIGTLVLGIATSMPELITTISAIKQGIPDLAAGNLFGSNMFNMFVLGILDLIHYRTRILRKSALKHALSGSLAVFMIGLIIFFQMANIQWKIGFVGVDSITIILVYVIAIRLIQKNTLISTITISHDLPNRKTPRLLISISGFVVATIILVLVTPWMVKLSNEIAIITGLGSTFIGTTLVAFVTSLPELVSSISGAKIGATDMAISNLFGSNLFNMAAIGIADFFFLGGRFLSVIQP
jgi:cation:H+ antiporter